MRTSLKWDSPLLGNLGFDTLNGHQPETKFSLMPTSAIWAQNSSCCKRNLDRTTQPPFYCKLIAMQPTQEFHFQPPTFFNIYIFLSVASAREKNLSSLNDNWLYYLWGFRNAGWQGFENPHQSCFLFSQSPHQKKKKTSAWRTLCISCRYE